MQQRGSALLDGGTGADREAAPAAARARSPTRPTASACSTPASATPPRGALRDLLAAREPVARRRSPRKLKEAERVVEWAQANADAGLRGSAGRRGRFLLPQIGRHPRRHPARLAAAALRAGGAPPRRLRRRAAARPQHDLFGTDGRHRRARAQSRPRARARCASRRRTAPTRATRSSRCPRRPPTSIPAAGILTQGEGNVLSHVQLLARALGIPNVVLGPERLRSSIAPHDGQQVFLIVTPGGRVIIKEAAAMTPQDRAVYDEYTRNQTRDRRRQPRRRRPRLHIDRAKIDSRARSMPIDLTDVRRKDSGRLLRAQGRLPRRAQARLPRPRRARHRGAVRRLLRPLPARQGRRARQAARARASRPPGEPLPDFVERTYKTVLRRDDPGQEEREGARGVDHAAPRHHPLLDPPGAAVAGAQARPSATASIADGLLTSADKRRPSAASCAATPTSRTSTTSTAPGSTSPCSTASRSTTSTRG